MGDVVAAVRMVFERLGDTTVFIPELHFTIQQRPQFRKTKNFPERKSFVGIASYLMRNRYLSVFPVFTSPKGALGRPVSQLSLFTATFVLSDNPPHKDG
jgi:hypothetical protein